MWAKLTPNTVAEFVAYASTIVVGFGVLWRYVVRGMWRAWKRVSLEVEALHDLANRELTHNGGSSLKGAVHRIDNTLAAVGGKLSNLEAKESETHDAVNALAQVMDAVIERKQEDHSRLWEAIGELGGPDPRSHLHRRSDD